MLLQLDVNNVALIDKISIEFGKGLSILTGETGAGKSILIDSINAVLGDRTGKDIIRNGTDKAIIEAVFSSDSAAVINALNELGIEDTDETIILSREITVSGKNTCRINGRLVNLSTLKQIGEMLINIHGQHDNQSLLKPETHIDLLDAFGGDEIVRIKRAYLELFNEYKTIKAKLEPLLGDKGEIARRSDMLKYQIEEIKAAKLIAGEDEGLNKQRRAMANSEKIMASLINCYSLLSEGTQGSKSVVYNLNKALTELSGILKYDESMLSVTEKLEAIIYQLEDICEEIREKRDESEFNPEALSQIDERLDIIARLKRKYGNSIEDVINFCNTAQNEYTELVQSEERAAQLNKQLSVILNKMGAAAETLHTERLKAADILENNITRELEYLEMKNASFKVNISYKDISEASFNKNGLDAVEFLISSNVGEPLKSLSKIASGGEMSRIMLAIKTILADVDEIPTLIFDEIDSGISGKAAQKVGEKLSFISAKHQVLCVTHLSQLACMADNHFYIMKHTDGRSTYTTVTQLDMQGRLTEIARIIGGSDVTDLAIKHAKELIDTAAQFKKTC